MAITRAQQVRQMLIKGGVVNPDGRRGFFKGAQDDTRRGSPMSPGTSVGGNTRGGTGKGRDLDVQQRGMTKSEYNRRRAEGTIDSYKGSDGPPKTTTVQKDKRFIPTPVPKGIGFLDRTRNKLIQASLNRNKVLALKKLGLIKDPGFTGFVGTTIDALTGKIPEQFELMSEEDLLDIATSGPYLSQQKTKGDVNKFSSGKDLLGRVFEAEDLLRKGDMTQTKYDKLFPGLDIPEDIGGEGGIQDPCKGPNPPAYCFVGIRSVEPKVEEYVNPLSLLTPRIAGTQFAADGGRIGFFKGAVAGGGNISPGTDVRGNVRDDNPFTGGGGDGPKTTPTNVGGGGVTTLKTKKDIRTPSDFTRFDLKDLVNLYQDEEDEDMKLAKTYSTEDIEKLLGIKDQKTAEQFIEDPFTSSPRFIGDKSQANIMEKFRENLLEQETKFPGKDFDAQRAGALSFGISPKNQSLVPSDFLDKPGEAATQIPFSVIAKEIEKKYPMAEGGIANLDREAFLLGGIAKGLKKAVRGVKKLVKSPIGKAALLGGLAYFGGGGGLPKFLSGKGLGGFSMKTLFSKANPLLFTDGKLSLGKLALASAATPFLFPGEKKDEFDLDAYYAANRLDPNAPLNTRIAGSQFDFYGGVKAADGGRIGYQEGGDAEPVAKKTMPLLDMDGKEKDYRETGGFVDMGRMERADDVPARLSKNEFVFTADAVRNAGDGDIDKGAEVMYNMMKNLEAGGEVSEESQGLEGARKMFQTSQRLGEVI